MAKDAALKQIAAVKPVVQKEATSGWGAKFGDGPRIDAINSRGLRSMRLPSRDADPDRLDDVGPARCVAFDQGSELRG
jgi:hypothetical protein